MIKLYDIKRRKELSGMTVKDVIAELSKMPSDAVITCCGDSYVWLHVEQDSSVVCIDNESLDDCYDRDYDCN